MYSACLFCHSWLGTNERLPHFPVGRRVAFDQAKGRLWVICGGCNRWNLTPLDERWEAIDTCERLFRDTRVRISTGNVGLAELADGFTLIRIGKPLRPEFAAWRYGRHFRARRWKSAAAATAIVGTALGATLGAAAAGFIVPAFLTSYGGALWIVDEGHKRRRARTFRAEGRLVRLSQDDVEATRVFNDGANGEFGLALHHTEGVRLIRGPEAQRILGQVIPALTPFGGDREAVQDAIELVDSAGSAEDCITSTVTMSTKLHGGWFAEFPVALRLALEMSLQEEGERRALDGELAALEAAWREAEQIASIADELLVPAEVLERIMGMRGTRRPGFAFG